MSYALITGLTDDGHMGVIYLLSTCGLNHWKPHVI